MDHGTVLRYRFGFIRLELAHEMPGEREILQLSVLGNRFLMAVLPHVFHSRLRQFPHQRGRMELRDDDGGDFLGRATSRHRRCCHFLLHCAPPRRRGARKHHLSQEFRDIKLALVGCFPSRHGGGLWHG